MLETTTYISDRRVIRGLGTYAMVCIEVGKSPTSFFTDTLPCELFLVIEDIPSIEIFLWRLWHVAESIQLLYPSDLAGEGFDAAVDSAGFLLG